MPTHTLKDTVTAFYAATRAMDADALVATFAPDAVHLEAMVAPLQGRATTPSTDQDTGVTP